MKFFLMLKKESYMTNTEWKELKKEEEEVVVPEEWVIFSLCSEWEVMVKEDPKKPKKERLL